MKRPLAPAEWSAGALPLIERWLQLCEPPAVLTPSEWAEAHIVLPPETNAEPGPLRLTSYQSQCLNQINAPGVRIAVLMWASQCGKSALEDCITLHKCKTAPGPLLMVQPNNEKARAYIKERLDPMVKRSPALKGMFGSGRTGSDGDSNSFKSFQGGYLAVASSHKPDDLASRAIRYVVVDELDRFALSSGQEGSPELLAIKRLHTFRDRSLCVIASTPTDDTSRIAKWFDRTDQRKFFVPCPACGTLEVLSFDRLKWTKGKPETAYLSCSHCAHKLDNKARLKAIDQGEWLATSEDGEPGTIGFWADVTISNFTSLQQIATDAEAAETSLEAKRVFVNTSLAQVYSPSGFEIDPTSLRARAIPITEPLPNDVVFVTAAADVQGNRIEVMFMAWGDKGQTAIVDYQVFPGDPTGPAVWDRLSEAFGRTFRTADNRILPLAVTAVDTGYQSDLCFEFVAKERAMGRTCKPLKSVHGFDKPRIKRSTYSRMGASLHLVGVDSLKELLYARLMLPNGEKNCVYLPEHLLDTNMFEGLTAERLVTKYVRGFPRKEWSRPVGRYEALDTAVYNLCLYDIVPKWIKSPEPVRPLVNLNELNHQGTTNGSRYH